MVMVSLKEFYSKLFSSIISSVWLLISDVICTYWYVLTRTKNKHNRHTFNTNMLKAGVDQTVTMKLTGHKTNAMFLRYSHIDQEMGELAMGKLSSFLGTRNSCFESA